MEWIDILKEKRADIKPEKPGRIITIHVVEIACATDQQKKLDELKGEVSDQYRVS